MPTEWSDQIVISELSDEPALSEELTTICDRLTADNAGPIPHVVLNFAAVTYVNSSNIAQLLALRKTYFKPDGSVMVEALKGIDLVIRRGEYVAIMGASGSGKSTLMNVLGCLDRPSSGAYLVDGHDVSKMSDETLSAF